MFCYSVFDPKEDKHSKILENLVSAWQQSSKFDQRLQDVIKIKKDHPHGWGIYFLKNEEKDKLIKSSRPLFEADLSSELKLEDLSEAKKLFMIAHARLASPGMPISLRHNHPFEKDNYSYILAHNGSTSKIVLNKLLNNKFTTSELKDFSDTELLFWVLEADFKNSEAEKKEETWKDCLRKIVSAHKKADKHYSLNLFFFNQSNQTLYFSSVYSKLHFESYLKLYLVKDSSSLLICSSTIKDFLNTKSENSYELDFIELTNNIVGSFGMKTQQLTLEGI